MRVSDLLVSSASIVADLLAPTRTDTETMSGKHRYTTLFWFVTVNDGMKWEVAGEAVR